MKTIFVSLSFVGLLSLLSCNKDYTCECTNPGGTNAVFTVKDSKEKAEKQCDDYYEANWGNVPLSETVCEIK